MTSEAASIAELIVGSWSLVSYRTANIDGSAEDFPLGQDARGIIIYTVDGHMAVQIAASHRPPYVDAALHGGTAEERAAAAASYLAYGGQYTVEGRTVVHKPWVSLFPNRTGTDVPRFATIRGDLLTLDLVAPIISGGVERTGTLTWRRIG